MELGRWLIWHGAILKAGLLEPDQPSIPAIHYWMLISGLRYRESPTALATEGLRQASGGRSTRLILPASTLLEIEIGRIVTQAIDRKSQARRKLTGFQSLKARIEIHLDLFFVALIVAKQKPCLLMMIA